MVDNHSYSFFGQKVGLIIQSALKSEPYIFFRLIKCKNNGTWEKPSSGEGKIIKFSLEEMVCILRVLEKEINSWTNKVKQLKEKKIEYKTLLDNFIEEKKKIQKSTNDGKASKNFISIKQIERKIDNLERIIETENLNIVEENAIIDDIRKLAEMKQEFFGERQNSDLFKLERKIEIVKINLNKIYEQLNKWSNKSQENHAKMQDLFQRVNTLKEKKKKMEEELIENKKAADHYHEQFLKLMNQRRKISKGKRPYYTSKRPVKKPTPSTKKNELLEKLKQDKLEKALEKQKAGKKLNLYEARLILEQSKG